MITRENIFDTLWRYRLSEIIDVLSEIDERFKNSRCGDGHISIIEEFKEIDVTQYRTCHHSVYLADLIIKRIDDGVFTFDDLVKKTYEMWGVR